MTETETGYLSAVADVIKILNRLDWLENGRGEWGAGASHALREIKGEIKKLIPEDLRYKLEG